MNLYFVLLRQSKRGTKGRSFTLDLPGCSHLLRRTGIQIFDIYTVSEPFEVLLICQAQSNDSMRRLFEELCGWEITSVLVRNHVGRFGTAQEISTSTWIRSRPRTLAHNIVGAADQMSFGQMLAVFAGKSPRG
jgi:hypothetical protein